ncbi:MAG: ANTAR domain-containing protein [Oscillospiraceae bacterium]|nr:ANTAR domain-containing protein [Oscillospiraceae bacterium]
MEKVIVAFENEKSCQRISDLLDSAGVASCLVCRSGAEVRRLVGKQHILVVVCGFKLADGVAEDLFEDLPDACSMLMVAQQGCLDLCENEDIFKLPTPVSKSDLLASVRILLHMGRRLEKFIRPQRSNEERELIDEAKRLLMDANGMTEEQAHRFLQKRSMDNGLKMVQTARLVLDEHGMA